MATLTKNGKRVGRPPGRKSGTTLLKEGASTKLLTAARDALIEDAPAIVKAMVKKAKGGDVAAAKLILDRVVPVEGMSKASMPDITIVIGKYDAQTNEQEPIDTEWEECTPPSPKQIEPISDGEVWDAEGQAGEKVGVH